MFKFSVGVTTAEVNTVTSSRNKAAATKSVANRKVVQSVVVTILAVIVATLYLMGLEYFTSAGLYSELSTAVYFFSAALLILHIAYLKTFFTKALLIMATEPRPYL